MTDFASCLSYGNPVMESYPRQCRDGNGTLYVEDNGVSDLIHVTTTFKDGKVKSPVNVVGEARGTWFFEASFPVTFQDEKGKVLAHSIATTTADWMTENFIPFKTSAKFTVSTDTPGFIILKRDNPSGNTAFDRELRIPVVFIPTRDSDIINTVSQ